MAFRRMMVQLVCVAVAGCSSTTTKGTVVGTSGGQVMSSDGVLELTIPAGALPKDTTITIEAATDVPAGTIGTAYDIGPEGTQFASPVALRFTLPPGQAPDSVAVGFEVNGAWEPLGVSSVDANTVAATTTHLSRYGLYGAIACTSSTDCPAPSQCVDGGCAFPCATQSDCPAGLYCTLDPASGAQTCTSALCDGAGTCPALGGVECSSVDICAASCTMTSECPVGQVCLGGTCAYQSCASSAGCPSGSTCYSGVCFPSDAGCTCGAPGCLCTATAMGPHYAYTIDQLILPKSSTEARMYGLDLNGDGTVDNQFGATLAALYSEGQLDVTATTAGAIARGEIVLHADLQTTDFVTADDAGFSTFQGSASSNAPMLGNFNAGVLMAGPGHTVVEIEINPGSPIELDLIGAHAKVSGTAGGLTSSVIGGALTIDDVNNKVVPSIALWADAVVGADCTRTGMNCGCVTGSEGSTVVSLFDTNMDCSVSVIEVQNNSIIMSLLQPDVVVENQQALSFGLGFTARSGF